MDKIFELLGSILYAVVAVIAIAVFIGTVTNIGLASEPGDPFYVAWLDVTRYRWRALILIVPESEPLHTLFSNCFPTLADSKDVVF